MDYIICEDSTAGYFFWQQINRVLFNNKYVVYKSEGITDLYKKLENINFEEECKYLFCIDCCNDNEAVR